MKTSPTTTTEIKADTSVEKRRSLIPRIDLAEGGESLTLWADLPGADEESIDVLLEGNTLTIRARSLVVPPEGFDLRWSEYTPVDYERRFTLALEIDRESVRASFAEGVLRLDLAKKGHRTRRIPIGG